MATMINTLDTSAGFALDVQGLEALRRQGRENPQQALKGVARQFEAVFLHTLLKSMRDAGAQDGPMDSDQTRMYTAMLDQQLAQSMSARGTGLADMMVKQLTRNPTAVSDPPARSAPAAAARPGAETPATRGGGGPLPAQFPRANAANE